MAKRRIGLTEKKIEQMEKEGRGQGTGRIINLGLTFRIFQATDCLQEEKGGRRIESINFYPSWNVIISMCWNGTTLL